MDTHSRLGKILYKYNTDTNRRILEPPSGGLAGITAGTPPRRLVSRLTLLTCAGRYYLS